MHHRGAGEKSMEKEDVIDIDDTKKGSTSQVAATRGEDEKKRGPVSRFYARFKIFFHLFVWLFFTGWWIASFILHRHDKNWIIPRTRGKQYFDSETKQQNELLPSCEGPKMHPYVDPNPKIEFEERLDDSNEGNVFKVKINSQPFALKVFKFFNVSEARKDFETPIDEEIPNAIVEMHCDPFYAECRAYGRINEFYNDTIPEQYEEALREFFPNQTQGGEKAILAAQCYGYLHLSAEDEEYLSENYPDVDWRIDEKDEGKPLRALVKQLIDPIDDEGQPDILQMYDGMRTLHGIGVFPNKNSPQNYRDGHFMSFSGSYTVPHCAIQALPDVQAEADFEIQRVDRMIDEQGIETSMTAVY